MLVASILAHAEPMAGTRGAMYSGCEVTLSPDVAPPQSVAAAIKWTATAWAKCGSQPVFKFSVSNGRDREGIVGGVLRACCVPDGCAGQYTPTR